MIDETWKNINKLIQLHQKSIDDLKLLESINYYDKTLLTYQSKNLCWVRLNATTTSIWGNYVWPDVSKPFVYKNCKMYSIATLVVSRYNDVYFRVHDLNKENFTRVVDYKYFDLEEFHQQVLESIINLV